LMILIISALSVMTYQRNLVWNDEVSLWTDNISKTPLLARPYSNLGKEYLDKMILDKALSYCRRAVNIEPDFADAHLNLGSVYILLRDQKAAVNEIKKAIDLDPYRPEFYINLGRAYMVTNDVIKAAAAYEEAIKIDFSQKDRIEEFNFVSHKAIISLEKMLNEVPGNIDVRRQYIELLRLTGQKKEAIAAGQLLLEMDPANVKAWNDLGLLYYEENNVDKAISCFEKALEYDPDFGKAHMNLGMIYMGGDLNKSIAHLEKALDYMPEDKKLKRTLLILKAIRKWRYLKQRWLM